MEAPEYNTTVEPEAVFQLRRFRAQNSFGIHKYPENGDEATDQEIRELLIFAAALAPRRRLPEGLLPRQLEALRVINLVPETIGDALFKGPAKTIGDALFKGPAKTDITTSDLREEMSVSLPDGYILSKDVVFPDKEIPIKAVINGHKVTVGSGRIDPETGIFTGKLDNEPNGEILRGQLEENTFSFNPFLNVSELELSQARQIVGAKLHSISLVTEEPNPKWGVYPIEKVVVSPTGHATIEPHQENSNGPTPRFHNHD